MKTRKLGIGIIGSGRAGMIHARNFISSVDNAKLAALSDAQPESLKKNASETGVSKAYTSYKDLIYDKEVDAVVIAAPTVFHRDIALMAAEEGKHILCEKPMAMDADECQDMIDAAGKNRVSLQIGFMRRFDRNFIEAKKRIEEGEIGTVVSVKSLTHGPSIPQEWQYDIAKSNGPLAEVNSHDIDTLRWYTGSEFKTVYGVAGNFRCREASMKYPDFYDTVLLNATFRNGMIGLIDGAVSVKYGYDSRVEILGTEGIIFVGSLRANSVISCNSRSGMRQGIISSWRELFRDAYLDEDKEFVLSILEGRDPVVTGIDGKKAVEVVKAGNESIISRQIMSLPE